MLTLYPDIEPFSHYHLSVPNTQLTGEQTADEKSVISHHIYVEQCGNPLGIPVVFLHGGPGSGCRPSHRCYFDPKKYHIILFDQRGCGRSHPLGDLTHNTTVDLINDIEVIRQHIGIKNWLVFGGSWGATLAIYYAQNYSKRVSGLILRGIFLARSQDVDWAYSENGAAKLFPDAWYNLVSDLPYSQQAQPLSAIYQQLISDDEKVSNDMLTKLQQWEARLIYWQGSASLETNSIKEDSKAATIIQLYYSLNQCFIAQVPLLDQIDKIRHIPTTIIHGRYDLVCPLEQAWQLKKHWPEAALHLIEMAGHVASEPKITDALVKATNDFAKSK